MRIPHELALEFPEDAALIEELKRTDHDFAKLVERYDDMNERIFRIESDDEPTLDEVLEDLKKQRLVLKDRIAARLHRAKTEATVRGPAAHAEPRGRAGR